MIHKLSTAVPQSSTLTALYFLGLLGVLHEYACVALRCTPCHRGACGTSSRKPMHNPGLPLLSQDSARENEAILLIALSMSCTVTGDWFMKNPLTCWERKKVRSLCEPHLDCSVPKLGLFAGVGVCPMSLVRSGGYKIAGKKFSRMSVCLLY